MISRFGMHFAEACLRLQADELGRRKMKCREILKSLTAIAANGMLPAPAVWSPAKAHMFES